MANGVPPLLNQATAIANTVSLLVSDALYIQSLFAPPQWGVAEAGSSSFVLQPDSVISFEIKDELRVSDYPMEPDGFQAYNKVQVPVEIRLTMTKGGSEDDRSAFISSLEQITNVVDPLYDIWTPERVYPNFTIHHYDYRRSATNGVGLLTVEVWFVWIPTAPNATGGVANPASPSGASPTTTGTVQPQPATPAVAGAGA
jgi:hypothetical protein